MITDVITCPSLFAIIRKGSRRFTWIFFVGIKALTSSDVFRFFAGCEPIFLNSSGRRAGKVVKMDIRPAGCKGTGSNAAAGDDVTVRDNGSGVRDRTEEQENSRQAQWQAARFPSSRPGAPRIREPVQTDVMYRAPCAKERISDMYRLFWIASIHPRQPGKQST